MRAHMVCGILMHSSFAVTTEGLPLGLSALKFLNRKKFKGTGNRSTPAARFRDHGLAIRLLTTNSLA
jgi:hypothetical protein